MLETKTGSSDDSICAVSLAETLEKHGLKQAPPVLEKTEGEMVCRVCHEEGLVFRPSCSCKSAVWHPACFTEEIDFKKTIRQKREWRTFMHTTFRCEVCKDFYHSLHLQKPLLHPLPAKSPLSKPYLRLHAISSQGL